MTVQPFPLFPADDARTVRRRDLVDRLQWVIRHRSDELPDTLVAGLHAYGVACDRRSAPQDLIDRLSGDRPEIPAAAS